MVYFLSGYQFPLVAGEKGILKIYPKAIGDLSRLPVVCSSDGLGRPN
jgi:hypothetical protein